jgi:hypothetical protein
MNLGHLMEKYHQQVFLFVKVVVGALVVPSHLVMILLVVEEAVEVTA